MRNYCLWYIYIIPTVLRSNKIFKVCCFRVKNHQAHQTQKKVVEIIQEYLNLIKYSTFYPVSVVERKKLTRPVIFASFSR